VAIPPGTLDRSPPPFFRQGPSSTTKLAFFTALALFLMAADVRMQFMEPLRSALAVVVLPLQRVAALPVEAVRGGAGWLQGLQQAREAESQARAQLVVQAGRAAHAEQLARENEELRKLLSLGPALQVRSLAAEVLYEAADPYSRKLFIDRGSAQGVRPGSPVVNQSGVLGQVTHVYALTSEVTLLSDKDAAIPVLNARTRQRAAAFGGAAGAPMELRFTSANADVQAGDVLTTSGLDGVYPPGLPVATVLSVERRAESGFARILLEPAARADGVRHVLVLEPTGLQLPPRPDAAEAARAAQAPARRASGPGRPGSAAP
jgi:rod shape-determining protein MreC